MNGLIICAAPILALIFGVYVMDGNEPIDVLIFMCKTLGLVVITILWIAYCIERWG